MKSATRNKKPVKTKRAPSKAKGGIFIRCIVCDAKHQVSDRGNLVVVDGYACRGCTNRFFELVLTWDYVAKQAMALIRRRHEDIVVRHDGGPVKWVVVERDPKIRKWIMPKEEWVEP